MLFHFTMIGCFNYTCTILLFVFRADPDDPFAVGRGDLDPFGGGVGGMMMDPMRGRGSRFVPDPNAGLPGRLPR